MCEAKCLHLLQVLNEDFFAVLNLQQADLPGVSSDSSCKPLSNSTLVYHSVISLG
jgi:hypothetical protein